MKKKLFCLILLCVCFFGTACAPTSIVVNSSGDELDIDISDGICKTVNNDCTLRAAIMEANVSDNVSDITFDNVSVISPTSALPILTASQTHINGEGVVTVDGTLCINYCDNGFLIRDSSYNIIQGLTISNFGRGIYISAVNGIAQYNSIGLSSSDVGDGSEGNKIINNWNGVKIGGLNAINNTVAGNYIRFNAYYGVAIGNGARENLIGTLTGTGIQQGWNWISSNGSTGVRLDGVTNNHITGNLIGTSLNGNSPMGNSEGIRVSNSSNNIIGLAPSGEGQPNVISGNDYDGLIIEDSDYNIIAGNIIGTNKNGTTAMPNRFGVYITNGSSSNIIGTNGDGINDAAEGNLISGNLYAGIKIYSTNSIHNVIAGNHIGTNFDGTAAIGNVGPGISVSGDLNLIGTNGDGVSDSLEGNVISGNANVGIFLSSFNCIVAGNFIGVDITGQTAIGNTFDGIKINLDGHGNRIGTNGDGVADAAERNIISGNGLAMNGNAGIKIDGHNNIVAGNYIGTDSSGTTGLGNLQDGIQLTNNASGNLIGTDGDGTADSLEGNLISGNGRIGIWLLGAYTNTVAGNLIGTDISGTSAIPNMHAVNSLYGAVHLSGGSSGNIIGTNSDGSNDADEGNLISGNTQRGIGIEGGATYSNIVAGNKIGTDISGSSALGNAVGIEISNDAYLNQIGTDGDGNSDIAERNLVSGNISSGIYVRGSQNLIAGNFVGTDNSGTADLGNGQHGISIADTSTQNTIGGSYQKANLIAFNTRVGVMVSGMDADKTLISYNSIHSNGEQGINLTAGDSAMFTPNDPGDIDLGPNDLMNFPVLNSANATAALVTINGQFVDGLPNTNFKIEFFANDVCDSPSNHGEGKTYLGYINKLTNGGGNVNFLASFASGITAGQFITATAITGDKTSEFSECVEVQEVQNYSQELEEPCDQFNQDEMTLTTFGVDPEKLVFTLYVNNPAGYPGYGPDDPADLVYTAKLGEIEARICNFQGFEDRVYCDWTVPANWLGTSQKVELLFNLCGPPIFVEDVTIFRKEPPPAEAPRCTSGLEERQCTAAGGTYTAGGGCNCP